MAIPLIRLAVPADLDAILEIESQSFSSPHWDVEAFLRHSTLVALIDHAVVGVLVTRQVFPGDETSPPEIEILNLAVASKHRRQRVAATLLQWILQHSAVFFLEVRESNVAAQTLYRKFNFEVIGQRAGYYDNPVESALVMQMKRC